MIERVIISQFYDGRKTDGVLLGLFTYGRELMVRRKTVAGGKSPEQCSRGSTRSAPEQCSRGSTRSAATTSTTSATATTYRCYLHVWG